MAMKIFQSTIFNTDATLYFDRDLMQVQDSHLEWLKTAGNVQYRAIPDYLLDNARGDFFAVLVNFEIPPKYHRVIMLMNGLKSPADYNGQSMNVLIPDIQQLESITSVYMTARNKLRLSDTQR